MLLRPDRGKQLWLHDGQDPTVSATPLMIAIAMGIVAQIVVQLPVEVGMA